MFTDYKDLYNNKLSGIVYNRVHGDWLVACLILLSNNTLISIQVLVQQHNFIANHTSYQMMKSVTSTYLIRSKNINPIYLNINDNVIEHVHQYNFLWLHLNSRLTWNTHIEEISKKISRTIGVLKKLQLTVPKNILLSIYNALILPQINYCLLCWGYDSSAIFLLQKSYSNHLRC